MTLRGEKTESLGKLNFVRLLTSCAAKSGVQEINLSALVPPSVFVTYAGMFAVLEYCDPSIISK